MNRLRLAKDKRIEGNLIKNVRSLLRLKKERDENTVKDKTNLFRLRKKTETTKEKTVRDIRNLFELENEPENFYKPVEVANFIS